MESYEAKPTEWSARYHVARSQVWENSRGGQTGNVHLHLPTEPREIRTFTAVTGRRIKITRSPGAPLCNRWAWYDRDPGTGERDPKHRCPRCLALAERYGITWPDPTED